MIVKTQKITVDFVTVAKIKGTNSKNVNVERNGCPFGQLWTFKAKDETHPWHAKTLAGDYQAFYAAQGGLKAAKAFMVEKARGV